MLVPKPRATGPPLAVALVVIAVATLALTTCDGEPLPTEVAGAAPQMAISDAAHSGGNPGFFFLPPLVPDPSRHPAFDSLGFDASHTPEVRICVVENDRCPPSQTAPFPIVFTMSTGPGSETVSLGETGEHYIVNWHTSELDLDAATTYRIQVLSGSAELGYADVDVVNSGKELKNVQTGEYVPLLDGRTLPIKFRIEHDAVVTIKVTEAITVSDAVSPAPPPAVIEIAETIRLTDEVRVLPPVVIDIVETIRVTDACTVGT